MQTPLVTLLEFLDARVFQPTASAEPLAYGNADDRKLLKKVQKRVQDTRVRYFGEYSTASAVRANFVQDLHSKPGQELAADMYMLKLTRFEDIQQEFLTLCRSLGL